jgi:TatA/E family protein of Tat protein translocase
MGIGSLGMTELMAIFIIVLVFFGPRRFPEIARSMGSAMREFRRSLNQIQRELEEVDPRKDIPGKDILDDIRSGKPGNWLDPNKTKVPTGATPGSRTAPEVPGPEVTGEAAGAPVAATAPEVSAASGPAAPASLDASAEPVGDVEQLPMFDGSAADGPMAEASSPAGEVSGPAVVEEEPPTEDSRSG